MVHQGTCVTTPPPNSLLGSVCSGQQPAPSGQRIHSVGPIHESTIHNWSHQAPMGLITIVQPDQRECLPPTEPSSTTSVTETIVDGRYDADKSCLFQNKPPHKLHPGSVRWKMNSKIHDPATQQSLRSDGNVRMTQVLRTRDSNEVGFVGGCFAETSSILSDAEEPLQRSTLLTNIIANRKGRSSREEFRRHLLTGYINLYPSAIPVDPQASMTCMRSPTS